MAVGGREPGTVQFLFPLSRNLLGTGKEDPQEKQETKIRGSRIQKNHCLGQQEQEAAVQRSRLSAPCSG